MEKLNERIRCKAKGVPQLNWERKRGNQENNYLVGISEVRQSGISERSAKGERRKRSKNSQIGTLDWIRWTDIEEIEGGQWDTGEEVWGDHKWSEEIERRVSTEYNEAEERDQW